MDVDNIIIENIPLINLMIKQLHCSWKTNDEYQEYYDSGLEGLIKGAKSYDETKGKISTYLCKCIANGIQKVFYLNSMPKRCNPAGTDISLNYEMYGDNLFDYTEFGDLVPDPNVNIEEEIENKLEKERLRNGIENLENEKDREVLKMYYGLDGYEEISSCRKIAAKLGVSPNAINMRLHRAIVNLKKYLQKNDRDISIKKPVEKVYKEDLLLMDNYCQKEEPKKITTLHDLNSVLFAQIDKLNDEKSDFEFEIRKSYAISQLAQQIVANTNTQIKAVKLMKENKITDSGELELLGFKK